MGDSVSQSVSRSVSQLAPCRPTVSHWETQSTKYRSDVKLARSSDCHCEWGEEEWGRGEGERGRRKGEEEWGEEEGGRRKGERPPTDGVEVHTRIFQGQPRAVTTHPLNG
eukprot:GHVU01154912.1.p2 GENE.GHVU01154912.1~~GHVU01154912.1.p2  ORF type:complete len:110 (-),score=13.60 GHVU01154912.1:469-798(-)